MFSRLWLTQIHTPLQISSVLKTNLFHLKQIAKLKPILARSDLDKIVHAFITTQLDYCNALYAGVSKVSLSLLRLVQNAAARFLAGTRRFEHISLAPCVSKIILKWSCSLRNAYMDCMDMHLHISELLEPYFPSWALK